MLWKVPGKACLIKPHGFKVLGACEKRHICKAWWTSLIHFWQFINLEIFGARLLWGQPWCGWGGLRFCNFETRDGQEQRRWWQKAGGCWRDRQRHMYCRKEWMGMFFLRISNARRKAWPGGALVAQCRRSCYLFWLRPESVNCVEMVFWRGVT